ncbi:MAG: glycosyltransferase family 2 protein [Candidatus Nanoarchaeia archaeon]|nr:glycosyltransferase family 2 protein [Candidatus Nanoarchaeia archaeon]MDD5358107.1 glycosyltransferase family 2 protein [Candidatus Nanoarchaeia archaeon]MDD5589294.1 glycosyltransferase family 2 protein [Candidatus Nanoarchaeia archaeon]
MNEGLVSIIIPVYNGEKYIDRCLESIFSQGYKNIETILINDGSTDGSREICNEYAFNYNNIDVFNIKNQGPAAARNKGIKNSRGEFIFFLDIDDFIESNAIGLLIKNYNQYKADIVVGDFKNVGKSMTNSGHSNVFSEDKLMMKKDIGDYVKKYLKKPNRHPLFAYSWGRLFKSSIIKNKDIKFDEDLHTFEDVAFNFEYLKHTDKIFFVNQAIYNHQMYDSFNSATMDIGNNPKKLFGYKKALENVKNFLECSDLENINIKKEVGHADVCYTIIQLIRTCGQINKNNEKEIYKLVHEIVNELNFRDNLQFYSPSKGDSKIIPMLMKLKLVTPITKLCKHKAYKRYNRGNKK